MPQRAMTVLACALRAYSRLSRRGACTMLDIIEMALPLKATTTPTRVSELSGRFVRRGLGLIRGEFNWLIRLPSRGDPGCGNAFGVAQVENS